MVQHTTTSEASGSPTPQPMGHFRADLMAACLLLPAQVELPTGTAPFWYIHTCLSIRAHIFIYVNVYVYTHIRNAILCLSTHACIYIILTVFILQEVRELMMKWKKQSAQQPSCWTSLSTNGGLFWNILVYKLYVKNNPQIINKNHFLLKHIGSLNHSPYISAE